MAHRHSLPKSATYFTRSLAHLMHVPSGISGRVTLHRAV
ncbi:conserved hypothetical protein [Acetobacter orientalis]|uniref:Uncharacterized protein n=1 Tax=Acetobacter orientalis TaxID=146474 RepID=A0A2Z5ZFZ1_9PROT|nr:conserved hypothetical protein [Acetobacter orientalis]